MSKQFDNKRNITLAAHLVCRGAENSILDILLFFWRALLLIFGKGHKWVIFGWLSCVGQLIGCWLLEVHTGIWSFMTLRQFWGSFKSSIFFALEKRSNNCHILCDFTDNHCLRYILKPESIRNLSPFQKTKPSGNISSTGPCLFILRPPHTIFGEVI